MPTEHIRIFPLGDSALTVEFGNVISEPLNRKAIGLASAIAKTGFPGLVETVPAYASTTVFYDPVEVRRGFPDAPDAFSAVRSEVEAVIANYVETAHDYDEPIKIAVDFGADAALDLAEVAEYNNIAPDEVVQIFTAGVYRVYMLGFLPGFSYLGEVDERIATPRKESPRTHVPGGSVGIAGSQTGIYSLASPGGWQIIGRTGAEMFRPDAEQTCLLKPGDLVKFIDASK